MYFIILFSLFFYSNRFQSFMRSFLYAIIKTSFKLLETVKRNIKPKLEFLFRFFYEEKTIQMQQSHWICSHFGQIFTHEFMFSEILFTFLNNIINLYYLLWWIMGAAWKVLFKVLKFHPLATFYVKSSLIIV